MSAQIPPDPLPASPTASPAGSPAPAAERRPRVPLWAVWLPIACALVTAGFWWQTRSEIGSLRQAQRQLADDIAALRNLPTLDVTGAPALGPADAVVTLVEFSDYECPFCIRHVTETMPRIASEFIDTGRIRYVFRDFPIDQLHPGAMRAHEAARCADEQGRFWSLHRRLFSPPGSHGDAALDARAAEAALDMPAFRACLASGRTRDAIERSVSTAVSLGANGTPAFFLGVRDLATNRVEILHAISGAQPFDAFAAAIGAVTTRVQRP